MPESTQHPDGGVRVWHHHEVGAGGSIDSYEPHGYQCRSCEDGRWFPVAQAARLIDVADPKVRERIGELVWQYDDTMITVLNATARGTAGTLPSRLEFVDAIIAALQGDAHA